MPMNIGLTYDLRDEYLAAGYSEDETAEFDRPDTIEAIEGALRGLGHTTDRIGNARQLVGRLASGDRWGLVFNICEGLSGPGREAQVPAILDAFDIPYTFADPLVMCVCLDKAMTKLALAGSDVRTPRFLKVECLADTVRADLRYPLFAKPLSEGTGKGISPASIVPTPARLREVCEDLLERYRQPVLVEEFLPGREFTCGLLGAGDDARVLGTLEVILKKGAEQGVYSYHNKEYCESLVEYRFVLPDEDDEVDQAEALALEAWRALGCRDAGRIDIRSDAHNRPNFIEANPLAGLHPNHSDLPMIATAVGLPYMDLIGLIVDSAMQRTSTNMNALSAGVVK